MAFQITGGSGVPMAADVYGTPHNISSGEQVQFVALGSGTLGALALCTATNPIFSSVVDASGNKQPAMDAVGRRGYVSITDGTNTMPTLDAVGRAGFVKLTDGTDTAGVGTGSDLWSSGGGSATASVPSGAANTVVKASAGRLCRVIVTTAGSGAGNVLIYDNASTNSGTVIGVIPGTIAIGTYYTFDMPAANGITVANVASGPVLTVSYF